MWLKILLHLQWFFISFIFIWHRRTSYQLWFIFCCEMCILSFKTYLTLNCEFWLINADINLCQNKKNFNDAVKWICYLTLFISYFNKKIFMENIIKSLITSKKIWYSFSKSKAFMRHESVVWPMNCWIWWKRPGLQLRHIWLNNSLLAF